MNAARESRWIPATPWALVAAVLALDLALGSTAAEAALHAAPAWIAALSRPWRSSRLVAAAATAAILLPLALEAPGLAAALARATAIVLVWTAMIVPHLVRRVEEPRSDDLARLSQIAEHAGDAIVAIDAASRILFTNAAAERLFGHPRAEMAGREVTMLMPERLRATHLEAMRQYLATRRRHVRWEGVRLAGLHQDGREIPVEISFSEVAGAGGAWFTGVVRDLSGQHPSPGARPDEAVESLVDSLDGIIWEAELPSLCFTFVSRKAERILGHPVEAWINESDFWTRHMHPEDREWVPKFCAGETALGREHVCEYRMIGLDGRVVWLRDAITPVLQDGTVRKLRGVMLDISDRKKAEAEARTSEERLRTVVSNAPIVLFATNRDGMVTLSEGRGLETLGLQPGEVVGKSLYELYPDAPQIHLNLRRALAGETFEDTVVVGSTAWQTRHSPIRASDGRVSGVIGVATDVSERWRATQALQESETRYALAVKGARDGIWDWNLKANEYYFSPRWGAMLGYGEGEVGSHGEEWFGRVHPDDLDRVRVDIRAHLDGATSHFESEHRMRHRDGTYRWVLTQGIAVTDAAGITVRMAGSMTDITDRKVGEQQLVHNAFHDALTGLPNRALFVEHLERALNRARRRDDYLFAVLFIDLDRLKVVNDSLGHMSGDQLLIEISRRVLETLRPGDLAARFGGDEFAILVDDIRDTTEATMVAERVHAALRPGFDLGTQEVYVTASIGIAVSSASAERPEDLLRDADTAMYRAKALGGSRHIVFQRAMHARAVALMELETDLRRALARGDLRIQIEYQPIVSIETGRISGFEALGRWRHPLRGLIAPSEFIPVAEETGLIIPIGRWMLQEACRQMRVWQGLHPSKPPLTISVNFSSKQLLQPDLAQQINDVLRESELAPDCLNLEITESVLVGSAEAAAALFLKLKGMGVRIQLDDFGTGYSSLSYLLRFPIDTLKIDRAFVVNLEEGSESREIVRTIVGLAAHLKMNVIAEGVETAGQLKELRALDCRYAQGYFFSRPLTVETASALIAADPRW